MTLSILIISHNTRELTLACLESVFAQGRGRSFDVVVVDNASGDGSAAAIAAAFPKVRLLEPGVNLGFAAGNNLAARHSNGEWILLLNPDTVVLDGAIDTLLAFAEAHPEAAIFGGRTVFADGRLNPASCWRRPTPWSVFCIAAGLTALLGRWEPFARESYGRWQRDSVREVDIVSGCFLLVRRSVWDQLGGFDPAFFMYGEDVDLCLRARGLGYRAMICPAATIVHHGGRSEKVRADKMVKLFRAKAQLFERHWDPRWVGFGVAMLKLWALTRMLAFGAASLVSGKARESSATWHQVWRGRGEYARTSGRSARTSREGRGGAAVDGGICGEVARASTAIAQESA